MSHQLNSAGGEGGGDLTSLVNTQNIRSSIRRLFQNSAKEICGEIIQNSQRALAKTVTITTSDAGFVIEDDGHGLLDGVNGFHALVKIAESYFENDTLSDQMPMGIGLCSLLSHDKVTVVTFQSGALSLAIDTSRWWKDHSYAMAWAERLVTLPEPVGGLRIIVECDAELVKKVKQAFVPEPTTYHGHWNTAAGQGYMGILDITLDGGAVETGIPDWGTVRSPLIETEYQGCPIKIGYSGDTPLRTSCVNWYGQVIPVSSHHFQFYMEVRAGRPVNPRSPSRQGLMEDDSYHALTQFVADQLFAFLCDEANRALIKPKHITALFLLDAERARRECPYVVARPLVPLENVGSSDDVDQHGADELFTYDEAPTFINQEVIVVVGKEARKGDSGISSFLPMIGPAYTLATGDPARVTTRHLWWTPQGKAKHHFFHKPGEWALGTEHERPTQWNPVTVPSVFTYCWPDNTDFYSVDWTIGCTNILAFLDEFAMAGFNPDSDDRDYEDIKFEYDESVTQVVRDVMGRCVPAQFRPHDLKHFFADRSSPIVNIRFHYRNKQASAVTVNNKAGEYLRLKLL